MACEGEVFLVKAISCIGVKGVEMLCVQVLTLVDVPILGKELQEEALWQEALR